MGPGVAEANGDWLYEPGGSPDRKPGTRRAFRTPSRGCLSGAERGANKRGSESHLDDHDDGEVGIDDDHISDDHFNDDRGDEARDHHDPDHHNDNDTAAGDDDDAADPTGCLALGAAPYDDDHRPGGCGELRQSAASCSTYERAAPL